MIYIMCWEGRSGRVEDDLTIEFDGVRADAECLAAELNSRACDGDRWAVCE